MGKRTSKIVHPTSEEIKAYIANTDRPVSARLPVSPAVIYRKPPDLEFHPKIKIAVSWATTNRAAIAAFLNNQPGQQYTVKYRAGKDDIREYTFDENRLLTILLRDHPIYSGNPGRHRDMGINTILLPLSALNLSMNNQLEAKPKPEPVAVAEPKLETIPPITWAITLHKPWPYAVIHLGKNIENRYYAPAAVQPGEWFGIHAGKKFDETAIQWIRDLELGICPPQSEQECHPYGLVAVVRFGGCVDNVIEGGPWFTGPVGWRMTEIMVLPKPIVVRGQQRMWSVPQHVRDELRTIKAERRKIAA